MHTFHVTSCGGCPLLFIYDTGGGDGVFHPPDAYTCRHPQGGVVGGIYSSVHDKTKPPLGCPLKTNELLIKLCRSLDE